MGKRARLALIAAAALFLGSAFLPYWLLTMDAPTYPERTLRVDIYGTELKGDVQEWHRVSRLVGVKVPPPLPELDLKVIPGVMVGLAALSLAAALRGRTMARVASVVTWASLASLLGLLQYRLYAVGHDLDPNAPLRNFVKGGFTPPAIGKITVGSITTYHWPNVGALVALLAALLVTAVAFAPQLARLWERVVRRLARPAPEGGGVE